MNLLEHAEKIEGGARIVLDWIGTGANCVGHEQAQNRADVCTGRLSGNPCPHNRAETFFETAAGEAIKKLVQIKNAAGLRVDGEKQLKGCAICGCHLRSKVWTPLEHVKKYTTTEEFLKHPTNCWLRTEQNL